LALFAVLFVFAMSILRSEFLAQRRKEPQRTPSSREKKKNVNDADRFRKYLGRFGLDWRGIK